MKAKDIDLPDEQSAKAALMGLPAIPLYRIALPGVPNSNGRIYPKATLELALHRAQERIEQRAMRVSANGVFVGYVDHAEIDETDALVVGVKFFKPIPMDNVALVPVGTGSVKSAGEVTLYIWEEVAVVCTPKSL